MGALLKLLGKREIPSQSLVKAPSADLIMSDNEFLLPEPREIQTEMEPEKLASYAQTADKCGFAKKVVGREKLLHLLKFKNLRFYDHSKVDDFMKRYVAHAFKNLHLGNDLWWRWIELKDYGHPLPSRVAENIKTLFFSGVSEYSSQNNFLFFVSDIFLVTSRNHYNPDFKNTGSYVLESKVIPMKRKTEICFLRIALGADALIEESIIIDAWRGPTFSDEEAKI